MNVEQFVTWQRKALASRSTSCPLRPEPGRFFQTYNGSLVFVYSISAEDRALAVVVAGGHGFEGTRGCYVGESYSLQHNGCYVSEHSGPWTLMALCQQVKLEAEEEQDSSSSLAELALKVERRLGGRELDGEHEPARYFDLLDYRVEAVEAFGGLVPAKPEVGELYRTFNASLILVLKEKGVVKSFVLRGGHGLRSKLGEKAGETHLIDEEGFPVGLTDGLQLGMTLKEKVPKTVFDPARPPAEAAVILEQPHPVFEGPRK